MIVLMMENMEKTTNIYFEKLLYCFIDFDIINAVYSLTFYIYLVSHFLLNQL